MEENRRGEKFVLAPHLLYPHSVELFWVTSFSSCNTERHEHGWKQVKELWDLAAPSSNREEYLMRRWVNLIREGPQNPPRQHNYSQHFKNLKKKQ